MKTELLKVNEESVALGAKLIREGELVGFPTETVYGLGANALDARAVAKIFEAKGRPQDNPLITHVACVEEIPPLVRAIPAAARKLMEAFWPGPMKTELLKVNEESVALGARLIREGELVGFPTETVYGLGANALDARAVAKIFEAKGRPQDNPLITHVACVEEIPPLVRAIPAAARKLMEAFWPGPMTLILPKADCIPDAVSAGLDTVGIRLPANADARRLIRAAGCPIAAPSANRSGRPSPTTALHVLEDMDGRIPLILDGGACQVGVESSVIDATGEVPVILRPGGITPEMVERVLGHVRVDEHVMSPLREGDVARSPGMKYKHYAPKAKAIIVSGAPEHVVSAICRRYDEQTAKGERVAILGLDEHRYGDRTFISLGSEKRPQEAAARLFAALRELDERGDTVALCEAVDTAGIGLAVMNRMGRAAAFDIEQV